MIAKIEKDAQNEYTIRKVEEVEEDALLREILIPYQGKVILIDFWNTWCGPCLSAMKEFATDKELFKNKEVVFLYLADESSPETIWTSLIPTIGGEHFRLKQEQMDALKRKFGIKAIPSYVIYDKKGEQIYFKTGFEGAKKIGEIIDKHLEQE